QVDLDSIQLAGVVGEEFCLRELLRVEVWFPAWISPSGGADEELRHEKKPSAKCERGIIPFGRGCRGVCAVPEGLGSRTRATSWLTPKAIACRSFGASVLHAAPC